MRCGFCDFILKSSKSERNIVIFEVLSTGMKDVDYHQSDQLRKL